MNRACPSRQAQRTLAGRGTVQGKADRDGADNKRLLGPEFRQGSAAAGRKRESMARDCPKGRREIGPASDHVVAQEGVPARIEPERKAAKAVPLPEKRRECPEVAQANGESPDIPRVLVIQDRP